MRSVKYSCTSSSAIPLVWSQQPSKVTLMPKITFLISFSYTQLTGSHYISGPRDDRHRLTLTPQELRVAIAIAEGRTTREAAAKLYLSPKTVEYHLRGVSDKMEIRS